MLDSSCDVGEDLLLVNDKSRETEVFVVLGVTSFIGLEMMGAISTEEGALRLTEADGAICLLLTLARLLRRMSSISFLSSYLRLFISYKRSRRSMKTSRELVDEIDRAECKDPDGKP
jgi:hypothetical protein